MSKFKVVKASEVSPNITVIARTDGDSMHGDNYFIINMDKPEGADVGQVLEEHGYKIDGYDFVNIDIPYPETLVSHSVKLCADYGFTPEQFWKNLSTMGEMPKTFTQYDMIMFAGAYAASLIHNINTSYKY